MKCQPCHRTVADVGSGKLDGDGRRVRDDIPVAVLGRTVQKKLSTVLNKTGSHRTERLHTCARSWTRRENRQDGSFGGQTLTREFIKRRRAGEAVRHMRGPVRGRRCTYRETLFFLSTPTVTRVYSPKRPCEVFLVRSPPQYCLFEIFRGKAVAFDISLSLSSTSSGRLPDTIRYTGCGT